MPNRLFVVAGHRLRERTRDRFGSMPRTFPQSQIKSGVIQGHTSRTRGRWSETSGSVITEKDVTAAGSETSR